ncbi:hypothetical protein JL720_11124 [Aureococcus anophagefferens]|nr:hypothetical protein JL720_11124 [Aureococcus anophagefferens]
MLSGTRARGTLTWKRRCISLFPPRYYGSHKSARHYAEAKASRLQRRRERDSSPERDESSSDEEEDEDDEDDEEEEDDEGGATPDRRKLRAPRRTSARAAATAPRCSGLARPRAGDGAPRATTYRSPEDRVYRSRSDVARHFGLDGAGAAGPGPGPAARGAAAPPRAAVRGARAATPDVAAACGADELQLAAVDAHLVAPTPGAWADAAGRGCAAAPGQRAVAGAARAAGAREAPRAGGDGPGAAPRKKRDRYGRKPVLVRRAPAGGRPGSDWQRFASCKARRATPGLTSYVLPRGHGARPFDAPPAELLGSRVKRRVVAPDGAVEWRPATVAARGDATLDLVDVAGGGVVTAAYPDAALAFVDGFRELADEERVAGRVMEVVAAGRVARARVDRVSRRRGARLPGPRAPPAARAPGRDAAPRRRRPCARCLLGGSLGARHCREALRHDDPDFDDLPEDPVGASVVVKWLDDGAAVWYDAVVESSEPRGDGLALSVRYVDGGEVDDIDWPSEDAAVAPPGNRKAKRKAGALPESGAKRQG